jgi:preprotein translocase subunit SecG
MLNIVISFLTFVLILISLFMVLVILMQRANTNAGMGSAFGGGVTESAFGADTTNILTRATKWSAVAFFAISLTLYLIYMSREGALAQGDGTAPPDLGGAPAIPMTVDPAASAAPAGAAAAEAAAAEAATEVTPETAAGETPAEDAPQPTP